MALKSGLDATADGPSVIKRSSENGSNSISMTTYITDEMEERMQQIQLSQGAQSESKRPNEAYCVAEILDRGKPLKTKDIDNLLDVPT